MTLRRWASSYGLAFLIATIALAFAGVTAFPFGGAYLYVPLVGVFLAALHGGFWPGVITSVVCALGFDYFYVGDRFSLGGNTIEETHRLVGFLVAGVAAAWIAARYRGARHEAEDARRAAEAAEADARRTAIMQERLVAVVSHDLRNPLGALRGNASVLPRLGPLNDRQTLAISRMVRTLDRTDLLIRDLLDVARTRTGALLPVAPAEARLGEVCARVLHEVRDARPDAEVTLSVSGDDRAAFDPERMAQVVQNLVSNAIEHGRGGAPVRVRVTGEPGELVIEVENQGEAPPADLLFEPFARGTHAGAGLGLGLVVVREVARAHGGTAALRSEAGRTVAQVRLPRSAAVPRVLAPERAAAASQRSAP